MIFTKTCTQCGKAVSLKDAKLDEHWNKWSAAPAHAYCPCCGERLDGVHVDTVDLARSLTPRNLLFAVVGLILLAIGIATASLHFVAPMLIAGFGLWLTRTSPLRDHRIIGWLLLLAAAGILLAFYTLA